MDRLHNSMDYDKSKKKIIYLLRCNQFYKAGYTKNFSSRFSAYVTHNPYVTEVILTKNIRDYDKYETWIKNKFRKQHHRGEWFYLTPEDVQLIASQWFI